MDHDAAGPPGRPHGLGAVDHATPGVDAVLGREVAMVVLPPVAGDELELRTERVRRLAGLHHPNLVDLYDVDGLVPDTESTLVLQNVAGRSLDELTGPWHTEALARVAAQVTAGLAHAHTHEVLHGVIGPASVVVDAGLQAWLIGFTASLHPDLLATPGPDAGTRENDVAALGRTLRNALGRPDPPAPTGLTTTLDAMSEGALSARDAAERLTRVAENLAAGEEDTGLIAMPTRYFRAPGGVSSEGLTDAVAPVGPPAPDAMPVPLPAADPGQEVTIGHAAAPPSGPPVPPVPPIPLTSAAPARDDEHGWLPPAITPSASRADRRRRRRAHARRAALLGGAAMSAALASAVALWAVEGPSGPQEARNVPSPPVPTAPAADDGTPLGPTDQDVDTSRRAETAGRSAAPPSPPAVLPPAPPPQLPPPVPLPPTRTSTVPPTTTSSPPTTSPPSTTPTTSRPSSPPTTRTTRPSTPRSTPTSSPRSPSRSSGPSSRSPAALAAGR